MDPLSDYLRTLRSGFTRETYSSSIKLAVGDRGRFLRLAKGNRRRAEDELIDYVVSHRQTLKGSTISARLAELKSFLDWNEVTLN